ncbi:MAG TPA: zinc ribbon domain-containing protein [Ktedonobacteraceae bacterium]|nr:zinc ribbon domain-containing protein [Ktedonobacteraceae bacterium]
MSTSCTSCGRDNPDQSAVCQFCGVLLPQTASFVPQPPARFSEAPASGQLQANSSQVNLMVSGNQPNTDGAWFTPQTPQMPEVPSISIGMQPQQQQLPPVVQMGTISTGIRLSKVHAFAGRGTIVTHNSWFLSEQAHSAADLLTTSFDIFHRRGTLGLGIEPKNLEDHGTQTERRHYLILQRSIATVFLYIAPAGNDLYISRVTTALTSIDPFRRFLLIAWLVLGVLFFIFPPVSLPIWAGLFVFFIFSFRNWLRERDFWIYLRKRDLNDFQLDDLSLLEYITDETVFAAARQNKIDSDKLKPPSSGYQHKRRIRAI